MNATADAACRRARAAESRLNDEVLPDLAATQTQRDVCHGRLAQLSENPPTTPQPFRAPLALKLVLKLAAVGFGAGAGACAGVGCPGEATVGFSLASAGALGFDIVLELLERRRKTSRP